MDINQIINSSNAAFEKFGNMVAPPNLTPDFSNFISKPPAIKTTYFQEMTDSLNELNKVNADISKALKSSSDDLKKITDEFNGFKKSHKYDNLKALVIAFLGAMIGSVSTLILTKIF